MKALFENTLFGLRAALPQTPSETIGHDDFVDFPEMRSHGQTAPVPAAVLIPVIAAAQPAILFTRRTEQLARHGGQISFPGGRSEPADPSPLHTALRETTEETGIASTFISVAGFLPRYRTGTGFDILPVVGVVAPGFALVPDTREVAEIFQVPLAFFLDPANAKFGSRDLGGKARRFHVFEPDGHYIWGITAALLFDFAERLRAVHAMPSS